MSNPYKVIDIIKEKLRQLGADGLVCPDAECGCKADNLVPCGGDPTECQPGWISAPRDPVECDWEMWSSKEKADEANARIANGEGKTND